jgi:phosphomannomutase/phosphoglucomutase
MNPRVFREYDIRGLADRDLDDAFTVDLGRAIGTHLSRAGGRRIALGRDVRLSSPRLHAALAEGLRQTPLTVIDIGVVPTPVLYFAPVHLDLHGGVMITGSHNPAPDNGFKIVRGRATIFGAEIQALRQLVERRDFTGGTGTSETTDVYDAYVAHARSCLRLGERRPKIVIDAGNGTAGLVAGRLYRELGCDVTELYCEPDGRFPNHHPDPTQPENVADLIAKVKATGAELGLAFDGDSDRLGVVDAQGRVIWGDQLMILFARAILAELPGATFVGEVKCSQAMYDEIGRAGGKAVMWKVGHSLIKTKMKELGAALAGEMSGHLFFAHRYLGFDDAIYAGARLIELLSREDRSLTDHVDTLPVAVNTPELRVELADDRKFEVVRAITARLRGHREVEEVIDLDGVRVRLPGGWGLVRASNTQPALVMRFEAESAARLAEIRALVEAELAAITGAPLQAASH